MSLNGWKCYPVLEYFELFLSVLSAVDPNLTLPLLDLVELSGHDQCTCVHLCTPEVHFPTIRVEEEGQHTEG